MLYCVALEGNNYFHMKHIMFYTELEKSPVYIIGTKLYIFFIFLYYKFIKHHSVVLKPYSTSLCLLLLLSPGCLQDSCNDYQYRCCKFTTPNYRNPQTKELKETPHRPHYRLHVSHCVAGL